jgi:nitrile hydratase accessory protein
MSDQPKFTETWQAEAHAMVTALIDAGRFSETEWSNALGAAIVDAQAAGDPDLGDTYYNHWFAALEQLCVTKNLLQTTAIDGRQEEWRQAYLHTPHGQPVELHRST